MKKPIFCCLFFCFTSFLLQAQIPDIPLQSIYFVKADGGWDLYIKKLSGIESIILTESQRDPAYRVTAYSLRSTVKHPVNAKERRLLDGHPIDTRDATCYLIDSTPEKIGTFGEFYHFYITNEVVYGYSWARNGRMKIDAGIRINLRKFARKYGDYRGRFKDQWITLTPAPLPLEKVEIKPKVEEARAETTIVLLHSSEVDVEIAPTPKPTPIPSPSPSPAPAVTRNAPPALLPTIEKMAGLAGEKRSVSSSYVWLVVEKIDQFPFERIKDVQPAAGVALKAGEERVLCKYLFEVDADKNTKSAGFATYHEDAQGRVVRINAYGQDNRLTAVYKIDYPGGTEPVTVTPYDKDGNAIKLK